MKNPSPKGFLQQNARKFVFQEKKICTEPKLLINLIVQIKQFIKQNLTAKKKLNFKLS